MGRSLKVRPATTSDILPIMALEHAAKDAVREQFIRRSIHSESCAICTRGSATVGYGVLEYSFFGNGFISMLYVHRRHRRRGAGEHLMRHMEASCRTPKLFTSTNLSNLPMQSLLSKLGYQLTGVIHNLDPDDPELVYLKRLR